MELIKKGLAYVCELTPEQFKEYRGDLTTPVSPYRDRPIEENLDLFERMKNGEFEDNKYTLRAKIDLASGNFNMRDPVIYRIRHMHHHRQGTKWCIYPMYDFAHPIPGRPGGHHPLPVLLEFENHRPFTNWVVEHVCSSSIPGRSSCPAWASTTRSVQAEAPSPGGERRRSPAGTTPGCPPSAACAAGATPPKSIRNFCERVGVAKSPNTIPYAFLEFCLREDLNETAQRVMAVLKPVKLTITNYPEGKSEMVTVENNPNRPEDGTREVSFSRHLWIEQDDFLAEPIPSTSACTPTGRSAA